MLKVLYLLAFWLLIFSPESEFAQQKTGLLEISKFVDGDTFWVLMENGHKEKIRLIGIDTLRQEEPEGPKRNTSARKLLIMSNEFLLAGKLGLNMMSSDTIDIRELLPMFR